MRSVVQRVSKARVVVEGEEVGGIGAGLLALVGVMDGDGDDDVAWLAHKLRTLRVFPDGAGKMNLSVGDAGGGLLVVSQFTLAADVGKGARPSFVGAMHPDQARPLFDRLLGALGEGVATGRFGAHMDVELVNDGPVTLWLDSGRR